MEDDRVTEPVDLAPLVETMARLRRPGGCPWDRAQDHASLIPYLLEETYECVDALHAADDAPLQEELGDVLLQVVFHARIAWERGAFGLQAVVDGLTEKLRRRHPHVFDSHAAPGTSALDVEHAWRQARAREGRGRVDGVPKSMPALRRAQTFGARAVRFGFDWTRANDVLAKVDEELAELRAADASQDGSGRREELGDLLFTLAQLARHWGLDAEEVAAEAAEKFRARVQAMEREAAARGVPLEDLAAEDLEAMWSRAKSPASNNTEAQG